MNLRSLNWYALKNKEKLTKENFNEVDATIFAQISYFSFELYGDLEDKKEKVSLLSLLKTKKDYCTLTSNSLTKKQDNKFLKNLNKSKRFRDIKFNYFVNKFSVEDKQQFSAVTLYLNDVVYVSFRGTDLSLIGWRENFDLGILKIIPSQKEAVEYLEYVSKTFDGDFYLGGQSKGGNLAQYAYMYLNKEVKERVIACYNIDGPGFYEDIKLKEEYQSVKDRIFKYGAVNSSIGIVLYNNETFNVLKSTANFVYQHNPYTYVVKNNAFIRGNKNGKTSLSFIGAVHQMLNSYSLEERTKFFDFSISLLINNGINTVSDLKKCSFFTFRKILSDYKASYYGKNKIYKKVLFKFFKFFKFFRKNLFSIKTNKLSFTEQGENKFDYSSKVKDKEI